MTTVLRALLLIAARWRTISPLITRALLQGNECPKQRIKALLHTLLGACYATRLRDREVNHIHAHHGFFGSWIAMTAARLLGITFSLTLHGSDLLLHQAFLDEKLRRCRFCITISEYNRQYILKRFPEIEPAAIIVSKLGVDVPLPTRGIMPHASKRKFSLLTAGRLHPVKNHAFLIHACARLHQLGIDFECSIAGEGPERHRLESLIRETHLQDRVTLLGHIAPREMGSLYRQADLFLLTSLSEGIPLVLMEAMANELIVLAPAITGIPELISHEKTGYLYQPGSMDDFVMQVLSLSRMNQEKDESTGKLRLIRQTARMKIFEDFNRRKNLRRFADLFLQSISTSPGSSLHENSVLQQVQLSL